MSSHQWDCDRTRCLLCGDKDWFAGPECSQSVNDHVSLLEYRNAVDLLRRSVNHLREWWKWYGITDPSSGRLPLPPAGGVELVEDIEEAVSQLAVNNDGR